MDFDKMKDFWTKKLQEAQKQQESDFSDNSSVSYQDIDLEEQQQQIQNMEEEEEEQIKNNNNKNEFIEKQQITNCCICETQKSKYTCPACQRKTCGLDCLKKHKIEFDCSGQYKQEQLRVKRADFSENFVKKDYNYLEKTIQDTETIRKKVNFITKTPELLRFKLLKNQLYKKLHAQLQFAPNILQRHRENMSFYYVKNKLIYLTLEFKIFYIDQEGKCKWERYVVDPQSEAEKMSHILEEQDFSSNQLLTQFKLDLTPSSIKKILLQQQKNKDQQMLKVYISNFYKTNEMKRKQQEYEEQQIQIQEQQNNNSDSIKNNIIEENIVEKDKSLKEQIQEIKQQSNLRRRDDDGQHDDDNQYKNRKNNTKLEKYIHWFDINEHPENAMIEVPINMPLGEVLQYLRIKEYPTFFIIPPQFYSQFQQFYLNNNGNIQQEIEENNANKQSEKDNEEEENILDEEQEEGQII